MPRRATRTSWKKGQRGGPGRKKGTPNKATREIKDLATAFLDANYWPTLDKRWREGKMSWPEVQTLMAYGYGKPKELHEHAGPDGGPIPVVARIERVIVDAKDA